MATKRNEQLRHPHLARLKAVLSTTSSVLTTISVTAILIILGITIPASSFAFSLDPRLTVIPVLICLFLCYYLYSKERQLQDILETTQSVGPSFIQSTVRKVVENSIESTFEVFMLFPIGAVILGVILLSLGYTAVGTLFFVFGLVALCVLACGLTVSKFLASKLIDMSLGTEQESSETTSLLV